MDWVGASAQHTLALVAPLPNAQFVTLHGYDNYTTNLPLAALLDDDVLIAHSALSKPLAREHGGPSVHDSAKTLCIKRCKMAKSD